jgi:hypothetical protein
LDHTGVHVKFEGTSSQVIYELSLGKNENSDTPSRDRKRTASGKEEKPFIPISKDKKEKED